MYLYHLYHNFIHKFWNYCIATFDVIYRRREFITNVGFRMPIVLFEIQTNVQYSDGKTRSQRIWGFPIYVS